MLRSGPTKTAKSNNLRVPLSVIWGMSVDRNAARRLFELRNARASQPIPDQGHRRLVKAGVFQQTVRTRQAPLRARQSSRCGLAGAGANPNICGAAFAYACLEGSHTSQADYECLGRMKPKQMISHLIGFFIPTYLILSADFELKRPPTG